MDYTFIFIVTIISCFVVLNILYPFAIKANLVDYPDARKTHTGNVPLIGGIAMFVGFSLVLLMAASDLNQVRGILIASSIIIVVGALDDFSSISVRFRFLMQIMACLIMTIFSGVMLSDLGDIIGTETLLLGMFSIPVTIFAAVGVMNAMNMIDGIDGLAGISALTCFLGVLFLQFLSGGMELIPLLFVAVLIPFLPFNLRVLNKVFMGDAGSMFLGFGVAWVLFDSCQGEDAVMNTVTALWLFAVPVIDTVAIMFRRVMKGQSPFMPDREHLHHIFLRAGFSARSTLYVISLFSVLYATIGIMGYLYHVPDWIMFSGFMLIFFGYLWGISRVWVVLRYIRKKLSLDIAE